MANIGLPLDDETIDRVARFIANEIRSELVCCDVYERLQPRVAAGDIDDIDGLTGGHDICYWGEAAARIAETTGT